MGLIDLVDIVKSASEIMAKLNAEIAEGKAIIFFDAMYESQMIMIGEVLDQKAGENSPLFSVGSSGIEKALGDLWAKQGIFSPRTQWEPLSECKPMLVLSGSVSPITASQIDWAVKHGFKEIAVDAQLMETENFAPFISAYQKKIVACLQKGKSVIVHTSKGPGDSRISQIESVLNKKG